MLEACPRDTRNVKGNTIRSLGRLQAQPHIPLFAYAQTSMVSTRSKGVTTQQFDEATQQQQKQVQQAGDADRLKKARIPTAAEQENRLQADRAMIEVYRRDWQGNKGFRHVAWRHVRDVLWWLEHVCGINMLDYEEKVVVVCIFLAVLVLIVLGAYKQSTQLVHMLKQVAMPGPA